jgi:hypothetical protein
MICLQGNDEKMKGHNNKKFIKAKNGLHYFKLQLEKRFIIRAQILPIESRTISRCIPANSLPARLAQITRQVFLYLRSRTSRLSVA